MSINIDYNLSLDEIIRGKANYHKDQIEFHTAEYKKAMALLNSNKPKGIDIELTPAAIKAIRDAGAHTPTDTRVIQQQIVKPLVVDFLSKHKGKHFTTDIFDYISTVVDTTNDPRRAWITAISLALNGLTKGAIPKVEKSDTENGNIKAYEWIAE